MIGRREVFGKLAGLLALPLAVATTKEEKYDDSLWVDVNGWRRSALSFSFSESDTAGGDGGDMIVRDGRLFWRNAQTGEITRLA